MNHIASPPEPVIPNHPAEPADLAPENVRKTPAGSAGSPSSRPPSQPTVCSRTWSPGPKAPVRTASAATRSSPAGAVSSPCRLSSAMVCSMRTTPCPV